MGWVRPDLAWVGVRLSSWVACWVHTPGAARRRWSDEGRGEKRKKKREREKDEEKREKREGRFWGVRVFRV